MAYGTILVVDDDPDSLDLICEALSPHGYHMLRASSGPDAVRVLRETRVDLVILDVMMPDMNGFAVLDVIRQTPQIENLPVILETADLSRECGRRAVDSALTYALCKPIDLGLLVTAVRKSLKQFRDPHGMEGPAHAKTEPQESADLLPEASR